MPAPVLHLLLSFAVLRAVSGAFANSIGRDGGSEDAVVLIQVGSVPDAVDKSRASQADLLPNPAVKSKNELPLANNKSNANEAVESMGNESNPLPTTSDESYIPVEVHGYTFPLEIRDGLYHFVSNAAFMLHWMDTKIHFYDVALYLDKSSPLWDGLQHPNRTKDLDMMLGNTQIMMVLQSRMASRKSMAALVDALKLFANLRHIKANVTKVLDTYKKCYRKGPHIKMGSLISLRPTRSGLSISLEGQTLCDIESDFLGVLVLDHYFGKHSDFPQFRDGAFAQLLDGMPSEVTRPVVVSVESHMWQHWWVTALLVLVGLGMCGGFLFIYHNYCRSASYRQMS